MTDHRAMSRYLVMLRRWWMVIVGAVALGLVGAWVMLPEPPEPGEQVVADPSVRYSATHLLQVERETPETSNFDLVLLLAQQGEVDAAVEEELGDTVEPDAVSSVVLEPNEDLGTIAVSATQPTAEQVVALVDTYAAAFTEYFDNRALDSAVAEYEAKQDQVAVFGERIQSLQEQADALEEGSVDRRLLESEIDVLIEQYGILQAEAQGLNLATFGGDPTFRTLQDPVPTPTAVGGGPISFDVPDTPWARFALAALGGLVLGVAVVFAIDWLDTRVRTREDAEEAFGLPVVAELPHESRSHLRDTPLPAVTEPSSAPAEVYRSLRLSLALAPRWQLDQDAAIGNGAVGSAMAISGQGPPRTILVTSARDGEGKSTVVANLAASFAESGQSVLVVDCDFRRSTVGDLLNAPEGPGLRELADPEVGAIEDLARAASVTLDDLVLQTPVPRVRIARSGTPGLAPAWFLSESPALVRHAATLADVVLLDTGPLLATNEAAALIPTVDAVLVVTRSGRTSRAHARRAVERLTQLKATAAGVLLVGSQTSLRYGYYPERPQESDVSEGSETTDQPKQPFAASKLRRR